MKSKACCDDDNRSAAEQVPTPHAQYASLFSRSFLNSFLDLVLYTDDRVVTSQIHKPFL